MSIGRPAPELPKLSQDEILRYSRHLIIPEVGVEGQRRLKAARVLMVGAGGLGSPIGLYLAAAGVGRLGIVEFDVVDETNLQRQVLHGTKDVGRKKVESARDRIRDLNPNVEVVAHEAWLTSENALDIIREYDLVVDGTDNFATRYLVNDACVLLGKPNVYGSIYRFEGQSTVFCTDEGPCYRCLYPEPPPPGLVPSCAEGGVLGILPGLVGLVQATETVKLVAGIGEPLVGRLLLVDALSMQFRTVKLRKDPRCPACGTREIRELIDYQQFCGIRGEEETTGVPVMTVAELDERRRGGAELDLVDVREPHEWDIGRIEGARLAPLSSFAEALRSFDSARDVVLYCKSGARSAKAARQLQEAGFKRVWNLEGGILRWSEEIDPTVPRY
ncbi:molybdopterin-synthase adenylyltransferase MoeB [Anaeromyxobacter sp. Fw109-5]|uniref:molybdopterin-synthase adenylyltransferase MoeB n=1 Tax=Anaeromyxobacter sp. (strain Fw109-5) TaxID=404589 RepID=UPI0000ED7150|nr:molybdopterin-synthase adenylyltransferase MoeB [Anaeromyxobacter sp. Fw109-5]ABS27788.1 UBA/THIF-type NAD/FAD binding protein [Anaeromyxobacter sp. Fw109-5]